MSACSDPTNYLAEWLDRYLRNRDLAFRKILNINTKDNLIIVEGKDKKTTYLILPFVEEFDSALEPILTEQYKGVAVFNTVENLSALLKAWKKLSTIDHLMIYFVNPFSTQEKKWVINPKTHQLISDDASLKEGINSLFLTVDETSKEEVLRKIKEEA